MQLSYGSTGQNRKCLHAIGKVRIRSPLTTADGLAYSSKHLLRAVERGEDVFTEILLAD